MSTRGEVQLSPELTHSLTALENPFVGIVLGLLLAAGLLLASLYSTKLVRPGNESAGIALASLALFARLAIATLALWAYKEFATTGFKPFAFSFAGGFVVMYTVELVRYAGLHKQRRPAVVR